MKIKRFLALLCLSVFLFASVTFVSCNKEEAENETEVEYSMDDVKVMDEDESTSIEEQEAKEKLKNADLSLDELNNLDDSSNSSSDIKE